MTIPKVTRDLLMLAPSFNLSPTAPLALARSLRKRKYMSQKSQKKKKPLTLSRTRQFETVSNPLGSPSYRSIQATRVATILNCKHYHPTLIHQRRGGHMTLYHQDLVATLSWPSGGPSHSSWGTMSVSDEQYKLHGIAIHCSIFHSSYHWDSETPIHLPSEFTA